MARVFLSYAGADLPRAEAIFEWLRADGHDVFFDRDVRNGIPPGEPWKQRLYEELSRVDAVVCLVTPAYLVSMWCTAEVAIATSRGCRLIPMRGEPDITHRLIDEYQHTSADPARARQQTLATLRRLDSDGRSVWRPGMNPYPGLKHFTADMSGLFFGRRAEIRELAAKLRITGPARVVAVVGPSGCGKSSLLRAGLVPYLESDWVVVEPFSPQDDPCYALATALVDTARTLRLAWQVDDVERRLAEPNGLRRIADDLLRERRDARHVLIALDQAEDLFAAEVDQRKRARFVELVRAAYRGPVRLVLTIRSEYETELDRLMPLRVDSVRLGALEKPMLRAAIEEPARIAALRLAPELTGRLLEETDTGDALPLLAFTLHRLADGRGRGADITLERYEELGGLKEILAAHAEAALVDATKASGLDKEAVKAGLVRMVDEDSAGRRTRRPIDASSLSEPMRAAMAVFVERRLLVSNEGHLRFVHDALLTAWPELAGAIDERARALRAAALVDKEAAAWRAANEDESYLVWDERRFTAVVTDLGGPEPADWAVDVDEQGRRFLTATREKFERNARRARRRLVSTLTVLSILLVMVLVAGVIAVFQAREAQSERDAATIRELMARAESVRLTDPQLALRLGLVAETLGSTVETRAGLLRTLTMNDYAATITDHTSSVFAVAFSPDGTLMASGDGDDHTVRLWDVTDIRDPRPLGDPITRHSTWVTGAAFSPDGDTLATVSRVETILWDVREPARPKVRTVLSRTADTTGIDDVGVAFSHDGGLLAATHGGEVRLFDVRDPDRPAPLGEPLAGIIKYGDVSFSSDGRYLAASFGGGFAGSGLEEESAEAAVWRITDPAAPVRAATFSTQDGTAFSAVTFHPKEPLLALAVGDLFNSGSRAALFRIADDSATQLGEPLTEHLEGVRDVAFDREGTTMATVGEDGWMIVYDVTDPEHPREVGDPRTDHTDTIYAVTFGPSGQLATGSRDNKIVLWAPVNPAQPAHLQAPGLEHGDEVSALAFGPGGDTLATGDVNGSIRTWDITDPAKPHGPGEVILEDSGPVDVLAFRPGDTTLATRSASDSVLLWDVSEPLRPRKVAGSKRVHRDSVVALRFSPDGNTLWTVDADVVVVKWDTSTPQALHKVAEGMTGRSDGQSQVAIRPDGNLIASGAGFGGGSGGVLRDISNLSDVRLLEGGLADYSVGPMEFSPDGALLATGGNEVLLWDVTTPWQPRRRGSPFAGPTAAELAISPDGQLLAVSGENGAVTVWSIADPAAPFPLGGPLTGHASKVTSLAWAPDSRTLASGDGEGVIRLWDTSLAVDLLAQRTAAACERATRGLTDEEWTRYVGPDLEFRTTCG